MPIIDDLQLPIQPVTKTGPGVEAHETRKENDNHHRVTNEELSASFERVKSGLLSGLKSMVHRNKSGN